VEHASPIQVSLLLEKWPNDDRKAVDARLPLACKHSRRGAYFQLSSELTNHALRGAALADEASASSVSSAFKDSRA
jgi:hypothetical protein